MSQTTNASNQHHASFWGIPRAFNALCGRPVDLASYPKPLHPIPVNGSEYASKCVAREDILRAIQQIATTLKSTKNRTTTRKIQPKKIVIWRKKGILQARLKPPVTSNNTRGNPLNDLAKSLETMYQQVVRNTDADDCDNQVNTLISEMRSNNPPNLETIIERLEQLTKNTQWIDMGYMLAHGQATLIDAKTGREVETMGIMFKALKQLTKPR